MNSSTIGYRAEQIAAEYLSRCGYRILERNWRTRWCEIDIVGCKDGCMYFIEVKYRATNRQGSGLDYITPRKLQQMHQAAEWFVADTKWQGDYCLSALEVSGPNWQVTKFLPVL